MVNEVRLYIEGGGTHNPSLASDARQALREFFVKSGLKNKPKVIVCGGRTQAYNDYRKAVKQGKCAMLLVDSESQVNLEFECGDIHNWKPWDQLRSRLDDNGKICDDWYGADTDCHLMVQIMETWLLADMDNLRTQFPRGSFPDIKDNEDIEKIPKDKVFDYMDKIFGKYDKGSHSFKALGSVDPARVQARSKWAKRFVTLLQERMNM